MRSTAASSKVHNVQNCLLVASPIESPSAGTAGIVLPGDSPYVTFGRIFTPQVACLAGPVLGLSCFVDMLLLLQYVFKFYP